MPVTTKFVTEIHTVVVCDSCGLHSLTDLSRERCLENATRMGWRPTSFDAARAAWLCPLCSRQREAEARIATKEAAAR